MNRKLFIVTLTSGKPETLKEVCYEKNGVQGLKSVPTCFPAIPILEWNIVGDEEVSIILIHQNDADEFWKQNLEKFQKDLEALSERLERKKTLKIDEVIATPMNLDNEEQLNLFKKLCAVYNENDMVYVDVGSGPKSLPVIMFASLYYAERIKNCDIRKIGLATYNPPAIYDIRCTYELLMLVRSIDSLSSEKVDEFIHSLQF